MIPLAFFDIGESDFLDVVGWIVISQVWALTFCDLALPNNFWIAFVLKRKETYHDGVPLMIQCNDERSKLWIEIDR